MKCVICDERDVQIKNCQQCKRCYYRLRYHSHNWNVRYRETFKNSKLVADFGITTGDYRALFHKQDGKCPICQGSLIPFWEGPAPHEAACVDHDHQSNQVRGLVCHQCNRNRIGMNTLETAQRLVVYLESHDKFELLRNEETLTHTRS